MVPFMTGDSETYKPARKKRLVRSFYKPPREPRALPRDLDGYPRNSRGACPPSLAAAASDKRSFGHYLAAEQIASQTEQPYFEKRTKIPS
ncbi:predicted protein [Sclerotinia sclerotiorum 1980 UF-70]|uniref:Uncharacterized protein n=1 Tax=Sclerotinia sclerotiorum (strain ATCC 18683 / 1980 / Ss-1) TaxID=665079 RepID=A7EAH0_SCLS1|nr:predicted protein [Sclerotinia sclerotiorum 1980 UF-70]EDN99448.1 predicted protein [Sclerotinia sclerotiorum 1980 UF-70]